MIAPTLTSWEDGVAWVKPAYRRAEVNRAGKALVTSGYPMDRTVARTILANWRSAHSYPLHALTNTLSNRCGNLIGDKALITRRLKRLVSIENKLLRRPHTRATQIQDLGGCRVILPTIADVDALHEVYKQREKRPGVFTLHRTDDYISNPKSSGYRSLHLVYRYDSDKKPEWRNMRVELQMRSWLQHSWATAVEAASFFLGQDLKAGAEEGEGNPEWLRFFVLMAHWMAFRERTMIVPGVPLDPPSAFLDEIVQAIDALDVFKKLHAWAESLRFLGEVRKEKRAAARFLVHLDMREMQVTVAAYNERQEALASEEYVEREIRFADDPSQHVVLATAQSYSALRQGYPGFFADTKRFMDEVASAQATAGEDLRHA